MLILWTLIGMVACIASLISAFALIRGFAGYVRRAHRDLWLKLVPPGSGVVHSGHSFDITAAFRQFRIGGDDLGDPELARRRRLANTAERFMMLAWVGFIVGSLVLGGVLAVLAARGVT